MVGSRQGAYLFNENGVSLCRRTALQIVLRDRDDFSGEDFLELFGSWYRSIHASGKGSAFAGKKTAYDRDRYQAFEQIHEASNFWLFDNLRSLYIS